MSLQFEEISRKAASGTLTPAEREWLDGYLREHPAKRNDVDWDAAFGAKLDEKIAAMPALPGWERTERALHAEHLAVEAGATARAGAGGGMRAPGVLDRFADWLGSSLGLAINMQAVAVTLVLAQAALLGVLALQFRDTGEGTMRAGAQDPTPRGPLLRVAFRADLRESDLRRALVDAGGEIVGGPGQIGVYLVRIRDGSLATAAQRLRDSGTTELVEIVDPKR
jgi:hypothetical protein